MHSNVARYIHIMEKSTFRRIAWYTGWGPQPVGPLTQPLRGRAFGPRGRGSGPSARDGRKVAAFLTSPKPPSQTWGGAINLGRGIVPPQTPSQWIRGIYRPNIQDTVITVIGLRYRPRPIAVCSVVVLWRLISRKPEFRITKILCQLWA